MISYCSFVFQCKDFIAFLCRKIILTNVFHLISWTLEILTVALGMIWMQWQIWLVKMHREQLYCAAPWLIPDILYLSGIIGFLPDKSIKLQGRHWSPFTTICALLGDTAARLNELLGHWTVWVYSWSIFNSQPSAPIMHPNSHVTPVGTLPAPVPKDYRNESHPVTAEFSSGAISHRTAVLASYSQSLAEAPKHTSNTVQV